MYNIVPNFAVWINSYFYFKQGVGVDKHTGKAMEWFKKAAEQGHPHASYNLAVGQLRGMHDHIDD